jgi:hypothetical protein
MADLRRPEDDVIEAVASRLAGSFADSYSAEEVRRTVDAHYHRFDGSRVRGYVHLLVEHDARDDLRTHAGRRFAPA